MGRLKALTISIMIGAGGGVTEGAPLDDAAPSSAASTVRPPLPKPAAEYLKAAAYLQNSGKSDLAAKYLKVARDYRDQLTEAERTVLDEYSRVMSPAAMDPQTAPAAMPVAATPSFQPLPTPTQAPARAPAPSPAVDPGRGQMMTLEGRSGVMDAKQRARWALANAVELTRRGQYDEAAAQVAEARKADVKWHLFEDTPDKVAKALEKARSKAGTAARTAAPAGRDRTTARAKLQQARDLLKANQYDQAEAVAQEVDAWGLGYSIWEETPSKVIASARALRHRDSMRKAGPTGRPGTDSYDAIVGEARRLLATGRLEEAEAKAVAAQRLGVVPPLTSDRAEAVLNDIVVARGQAVAAAPGALALESAPMPPTPSPSALMEREADQLLARQDTATAAAKYAEAERLHAEETGRVLMAPPMIEAPAADVVIHPIATDPAMPAPAAFAPPIEPLPADPAPLPPPGLPVEPLAAPDLPMVAAMPEAPAPAPAADHVLSQARELYEAGNFAAAREAVGRAGDADAAIKAAAEDLNSEIALKQQGAALALYEEALAAVRNKEFGHARVLLNEVAGSGSLDESLQQRVQDLLLKIGQAGPDAAPIDAQADADAVAAQRLNAEVAIKVGEARRLMDVDPDRAIQTLRETHAAVKAADVPEAARRPMLRRLEVALELSQKDKITFDLKMQDKNARVEVEQKKLRILEADKAKNARMKEYMEKAQAAMADAKYEEAESWALRAQEVDPNDVASTALAWKARAQGGYERDKDIRRRRDAGVVEAFQGVDEAGVMDPAVLRNNIAYPKTFREISLARREANARLEPRADPARLAVERKLGEPVTLDMDKQPLGEAVTFLQNATGLNVMLDPKALLETGLTDATPVSMRLKDVKLKTALKLMLAPMGLTYQIEDDVLLITSPQNNAKMVERVYPVGDLVLPVTRRIQRRIGDATSPLPEPGSVVAPTDANGLPPSTNMDGSKVTPFDFQSLDFTPLIQVITASVMPGSWKVYDGKGGVLPIGGGAMPAYGMSAGFGGAGGLDDTQTPPPGSIIPYFLNISLIVRHTPEVHEDIVDLLRQLRKLQDLQVSVEVRFITLSDNFFERIGIDFDFSIQSDLEGKKNAFVTRNAAAVPVVPGANVAPTGPYLVNQIIDHSLGDREPYVAGANGAGDANHITRLTQNLQMPFNQGSFGLTQPFNNVPGAGGTFGISFLSDLEVYFFLEAAQGDTRSNILAAPKVTTFNGATATIFSGTLQNYVAQLIPVVNFGAVAFQAIPGQIFDGVQLSTVPVVSADRRYVRLTLAPNFQTIDGFDTFPVPAAVGGGGIGGGAAAITGQIQLPRTSTTFIDTTVTVPDGGTVLLGGVKRLREERQEFGVPILSKTPWINRLFRNVGIGRRTDSLMLMVTPRIIILEEEEERLGIPALGAANP